MVSIADAARELGVTPRALRHYERLGLVKPERDPANDYRSFSTNDLAVLRIVVVLRRLSVPLEAIATMIADPTAASIRAIVGRAAVQSATRAKAHAVGTAILTELLRSLDAAPEDGPTSQVSALPGALPTLAAAIDVVLTHPGSPLTAADAPLLGRKALDDVELPTPPAPEKGTAVSENNNPPSGRLTDVRIVNLPRTRVAASHFIGPEPETSAWEPLLAFIKASGLAAASHGARVFGFNHPDPTGPDSPYGYEFWVTLPESLADDDVPATLTVREMGGGTYAAHSIAMGDFHEWAWLEHWVNSSDDWDYAGGGSPENMFDSLEEHLNLPASLEGPTCEKCGKQHSNPQQLDLLIPINHKHAY
jgi:DNA-binding transcriptional MerR regulator/DNA gyrase inhibitor GyrI